MAKAYNPGTLWPPFGAFSMMVLAGSGQTVHLKGQVALNPAGDIVGAGDMRAQVQQVLVNIETALAVVGGRMGDIVSLTHYATDIAAFMQAGDIRSAYFAEPYPVTTTVEVAALYDPALMIEIAAVAEIPLERFVTPAAARDMHR